MNWLAVYTKPRWEKKVAQRLAAKGLEVYCPLNKVTRKWSDRYKVVEVPLFTSYVFVNVKEEEVTSVRMTDGVVNFVYSNRKPAVILQKEIDLIRRFLNDFQNVEARPFSVEKGLRVRVISGVLMDREGIVMDVRKKKAYIMLESLGFELSATIEVEIGRAHV